MQVGLQITQINLWSQRNLKTMVFQILSQLLQFNFTQSKVDCSLFIKGSRASFVALLVYVDDIIITYLSLYIIANLKLFLYTQLKLKDLSRLKYFFNFEILVLLLELYYVDDIIPCNSWKIWVYLVHDRPTSIPMDLKT